MSFNAGSSNAQPLKSPPPPPRSGNQTPPVGPAILIPFALQPYSYAPTFSVFSSFSSCSNTDSDESNLFHSISPSPMTPTPVTDPKKSSESQFPADGPRPVSLPLSMSARLVCPARCRRAPSLLSQPTGMDAAPDSDLLHYARQHLQPRHLRKRVLPQLPASFIFHHIPMLIELPLHGPYIQAGVGN